MANVIDLIVFTPKEITRHGREMKSIIEEIAGEEDFKVSVTTWDDEENFFGADNRYPMNECIRKLHSFDGAILILGPGVPRRTGNRAQNLGNAIAWRFRRLLGIPGQVNSNVLIEIGASMARFGRNRVFLVEPKSKAVEVPSYFRENNAVFLSFDDKASDPKAAVAESAREIVSKLKSLGQSAYYSDLPSFGLAHGYLNALIRPALENVESGIQIEIDGRPHTFARAVFIIAYAKRQVATRGLANELYKKIGLAEALMKAKDGRTISFRTLPDAHQKDVLYIVDIPTNLVPSLHAINKIEDLWIGSGTQGEDYKVRLEQREIANFFRYLDILRNENKIESGKVRLLEVENFEDLTLEAIRSQAG